MEMTPDERDRLTILETKFDERWERLETFISETSSKVKDHETFIEGLKVKLAIVGMGFTLFGSLFMIGIQWLLERLQHTWGQ